MRWLKNIAEGYILDANYVCRYLLADQYDQFTIAKDMIDSHRCTIRSEVLAEVVYVLEKLYEVPRSDIKELLQTILRKSNIRTNDMSIARYALDVYPDSPKIDFVDCILYAYHKSGYRIATFDKKLLKKIQ